MGIKYIMIRELIKLAVSDESGINERFSGLLMKKLKGSFLRKGGVYKGELLDPDDHDFTSDRNLFQLSGEDNKAACRQRACGNSWQMC